MIFPEVISFMLGCIAGFILALTGAGGAILSVPFLVFGLNLTVAEASPIALLAVGLSASIGAYLALKEGLVRYRAATLIAVTGIVISPISVWISHQISNTLLTIIFSGVLVYVSITMFVKSRTGMASNIDDLNCLSAPCQIDTVAGRLIWSLPCAWFLAASGLLAGFLSGLLGVGGGFVLVPALKKASNLGMQQIVPTSLAVIALISLSGVLTASLSGHINWRIAMPFAGSSIVGMLAGRTLIKRLQGAIIMNMFSVFAFIVALAMLIKIVLQ